MLGARIVLRVQELLAAHHDDSQYTIAQIERRLHRVIEPGPIGIRRLLIISGIFSDHQPVDHHLNRVHLVPVQNDLVVQLYDFAIDASAHVTSLDQIVQQALVLALTILDHRRQEHDAGAVRQLADAVHDLLYRLARDHATADRAVWNPHPGIQEPQIIIDLCDGSHGGPRAAAGAALVDTDRGREPLNMIEIGLVHPSKELPRVGR